MTTETIMEMQAEERVYQAWVREQKNKILSLADTKKKQSLWNTLFPKMTRDDSWMDSATVW
jgi:hypothetical protein